MYFHFVRELDRENRDKFDDDLYAPLYGEVGIADILNTPDVAE